MADKKSTLGNRCFFLFFILFGCIYLTQDTGVVKEMAAIHTAGIYIQQIFRDDQASAGYPGDKHEQAGINSSEAVEESGTDGDKTGANSEDNSGNDTENGQDIFPEHYPDTQNPDEVEYQKVEDDYFADALFLGDSRTVGMYEYGGLEDISTFYASTGLSVYKLFTAKIVEVPGQRKKITVEEALSQHHFAKIYLMLGINEMGTGTAETFLEKYAACLAHLQELQPDAVIYLQSIMQVTAERSTQGDYVTNEGIDIRNQGIAAMADNVSVFYLDVNEVVCDEDGTMIPEYTHDGVHLKAQYIPLWKDYLKEHAVIIN